MPQGGATFVLELGQNLNFFLKIRKAKFVRTTSTMLENDRKKINNSLLVRWLWMCTYIKFFEYLIS